MAKEYSEPTETDNVDCNFQKLGKGSLICGAAHRGSQHSTDETDAMVCFNCEAGKIFRDVGCDSASPQVHLMKYGGGGLSFDVRSILCKRRRRQTTLEYCRSCGLASAETTKSIVGTVNGLFQGEGFYKAYQNLKNARDALRDGEYDRVISQSVSALESVLRICHEKFDKDLPKGKKVTDYWKSASKILGFDKLGEGQTVLALLNSLSGVTSHLGSMRNSLSDAHGRGQQSPEASEALAELALNTASTLATISIRRYKEIRDGDSNE